MELFTVVNELFLTDNRTLRGHPAAGDDAGEQYDLMVTWVIFT